MPIPPLEKGYARCPLCQQDSLIEEVRRDDWKCPFCHHDLREFTTE